tara:strand:+ start:136 stop:492 length:357 start_codon:yes stop_codon:yes gene_type:complete
MSRRIGVAAEEEAKTYLLERGLNHLVSNYRTKLGEIDLIMKEGECLVFVEVKYRKSMAYGHASSYVNQTKQKKIIKTAYLYLQAMRYRHHCPYRFDVLSILGETKHIEWIKNAFGSDY